jgi:hypothetical protein
MTPSVLPFTGGCLCGAVRYTASEPPLSAGHCHCKNCRKHTGAAFATDATFATSSIIWSGQPPAYYASSANCSRGFCPVCGSTVSALYGDMPEIVIIAAGSLDEPERISPSHHGYVSRRLPWIKLADGLGEYAEAVPGFEQN